MLFWYVVYFKEVYWSDNKIGRFPVANEERPAGSLGVRVTCLPPVQKCGVSEGKEGPGPRPPVPEAGVQKGRNLPELT